MKMRKQKKGFTITELVIVIAVIAVLAAVLIPTFVSLVRRANESKDIQLVHNLNTALTIDDKEHNTMQDALDAALESGYDVDKINASATGNEILWDKVNDQFCYLKKDGNTKTIEYIPDSVREHEAKGADFWQICDKMPETQEYSIYAGKNWKETTVGTEEKPLTVGFDAGERSIESIFFKTDVADKKFVIRTNSNATVLTVEAPNSTVYHYDAVGNVEVRAVDPNHSYHEFGEVSGNINVTKGHVVLEANANVNTVLVSSAAAGAVTVDVVSGAKVNAVAPATEAAKTDIDASTTIPAEVKVTEVITEISSDFAGGLGIEKSPYIIETYNDFSKMVANSGSTESKTVYFKLISDVQLKAETYLQNAYIVIDLNDHAIIGKKYKNALSIVSGVVTIKNGTIEATPSSAGSALYAGGLNSLNPDPDSTVNIENCTIKTNANKSYAVVTNGSWSKNAKINIKNSTISAPTEGSNRAYATYIPTGTVNFTNCNVTGHVFICGGNVTLDGGVYTATGFSGQSKIWNKADTISYAKTMTGGNAYTMGDSIFIADRRDPTSYQIEALTIRNITFNTKIAAGTAYAIKYVDMNKGGTNQDRVDYVIENNTFNHMIDGADPVMFIDLEGSDITK